MAKHHLIGAGVAFLGFVLFAFGFYILPFGTDVYLYFWVHEVFHGNWLYGAIAGNVFALLLIAAGLVILHHEGRSPVPRESKAKAKKKKRSLFGRKKEVYRL